MIDAICIEFGGCIHKYPLWGMVSVFGKISDAQSILQRTQAFAPSLIAEVRTVPFIRRNTSQPLDSATNAQTPVLKLQPLGRPAPPLWHLDRIDSYTHAFDQNYTVPRSSNGTGVHIYIIDDGAAPGEPAYAEGLFIGAKTRLVEALDFTSNAELLVTRTPLPDDYQVGHGKPAFTRCFEQMIQAQCVGRCCQGRAYDTAATAATQHHRHLVESDGTRSTKKHAK